MPRAQSGSLFGWFSLENLFFAKDFGLFCLVFAMTGVESRPINEAVRDPHLIEFLHLCRHDFFQCSVIHFFEETVIRPVGRQRLHDIETAVMGDDAVVVQIIRQICDL